MYEYVTHLFDESPWRVRMSIFEFGRQTEYCLANNLDVIHSGMQVQWVRHKRRLIEPCSKFIYSSNSC